MTIQDVIRRVRLCLDEEAANIAQMTVSGTVGNDDDGYMDNIIKDKIPDAVRWCALYAPDGLLRSDRETSGETSKGWSVAAEGVFVKEQACTAAYSATPSGHVTITLPPDFGRLVRVRLSSWDKAVRVPVEEDSDEYLMVNADTAKATNDRPVAALIRTEPMKLECWPGSSSDASGQSATVTINYVSSGSEVSITSSAVDIPSQLEPAFIYYIAFLVATAYRDSIANSLLQIARMHLGLS